MKKKFIFVVLVLLAFSLNATELKVASSNLLFMNIKVSSIKVITQIIKSVDVIGCQEVTPAKARALARKTKYNYLIEPNDRAIFTKYKIVKIAANKTGCLIEIDKDTKFWMFNAHLTPSPYGPYELANIKSVFGFGEFDPSKPEQIESIIKRNYDNRTMEKENIRMIEDIEKAKKSGYPIFLTGDFNEPSHLDWQKETVDAGMHPAVVNWPTSIKYAEMGFKDAWRVKYPDVVAKPGNTWTCYKKYQTNKTADGEKIVEPFDRLDIVYFMENNSKITVNTAETIGPDFDKVADIKIKGYGADHRTAKVGVTIN